jgi:ectoine hydroxylase-related dioxygenase (phytanoyl-CoA dioxygenase family)
MANDPIPPNGGTTCRFTESHRQAYERDSYVLVPSFFTHQEISRLYGIARNDSVLREKAVDRGDRDGYRTRLTLWYSLDDDIYGIVARCARIVDAVEQLLGGTVAHHHTKLNQKEPGTGGAWEWHQDYGYWYHDGFLFPDMLSVLTALTESTRQNGCLQVIRGSHKLGRIEHGFAGEQVGAQTERLTEILKRLDKEYIEMEPGDAVFIHCNLLHRSDRNESDESRWSLISAYNLSTNIPYKDVRESSYTPIVKVPDEMILESRVGGKREEADFLPE